MVATAIIGFCILCSLTNIKLGDIQFVEIWTIVSLPLALRAALGRSDMWRRSGIARLYKPYLIFLLLVLAGSLLSMRLEFYLPGNYGFLKSPPWASFVRFGQLTLAISSAFMLIGLINVRVKYLDIATNAYVVSGIVGGLWAIGSGIAWIYGYHWDGAYSVESIRLRGFFIEGGPFGLYLSSCVMMLFLRRFTLHFENDLSFVIKLSILGLAIFGTQSKAGILALMLGVGYSLILSRRIGILLVLSVIAAPILYNSKLVEGLAGYQESFVDYNYAVMSRPDDPSLVLGRLMAAVLTPRIVQQHPILGIGIGNYSLKRNDPMILRGLPMTAEWDLPGLGLAGYAAELGIPLTLWVLWLLARPMLLARRRPVSIQAAAAYPLFVTVFGVQLTFAYPWIFLGLVLASIQTIEHFEREERVEGDYDPEPPADAALTT